MNENSDERDEILGSQFHESGLIEYGSFTFPEPENTKDDLKSEKSFNNNHTGQGDHIRSVSQQSRQSFLYHFYKASYNVMSSSENESSSLTISFQVPDTKSYGPIKSLCETLAILSANSLALRYVLFYVIPALFVSIWVAIPFPLSIGGHGESLMSFEYFLFVFYGLHLGISILLSTMILQVYSISWWSEDLGFFFSHSFLWVSGLLIGIQGNILGFSSSKEFWILLSSAAMFAPLFLSWLKVAYEKRSNHRNSQISDHDYAMVGNQSSKWIPTSYNQFLWFAFSVGLAYVGYLISELAALSYLLSGAENRQQKKLLFTNFFMIVLFGLDFIAEKIVREKIGWRPLQDVFCIYFTTFYYMFYRTLFLQLDSVNQLFLVISTSVLYFFYTMVVSMRPTYRLMISWFGVQCSYEQHLYEVGRKYFIRGMIQHVTFLMISGCYVLLEVGVANGAHFPYLMGRHFSGVITSFILVWLLERLLSFLFETFYRRKFGIDVTIEAIRDFQRYPETILTIMILFIHVGQDMLIALLKLAV